MVLEALDTLTAFTANTELSCFARSSNIDARILSLTFSFTRFVADAHKPLVIAVTCLRAGCPVRADAVTLLPKGADGFFTLSFAFTFCRIGRARTLAASEIIIDTAVAVVVDHITGLKCAVLVSPAHLMLAGEAIAFDSTGGRVVRLTVLEHFVIVFSMHDGLVAGWQREEAITLTGRVDGEFWTFLRSRAHHERLEVDVFLISLILDALDTA